MADVANPAGAAYRIYVVEDSAILLRLLQEMLGSIPGVELAGYSDNADEAIKEIVTTAPDAIRTGTKTRRVNFQAPSILLTSSK